MEIVNLYVCSYTKKESKIKEEIEESERKHLESVFKDVNNPEELTRRYVLTNHPSYGYNNNKTNVTIWEIVFQQGNKLWLSNGKSNKIVNITDNYQFDNHSLDALFEHRCLYKIFLIHLLFILCLTFAKNQFYG
jgi:hypothetical protein